jgi:uncharacterized membrane protein
MLGAAVVAAISLEAALAPAVVIGGAAILAPRRLARLWRGKPKKAGAASRTIAPPRSPQSAVVSRPQAFAGLTIGRAAAKTVTFRIISSGLDFGWNYLLLGEVAAAAGLSAFSLAAAPVFYFLHETAWSRFRIALRRTALPDSDQPPISPAMAKTISFRTVATIAEFGTNYFVVREVALAAKLSAFGFVAGPFVYLAHEKAWEYYAPEKSK